VSSFTLQVDKFPLGAELLGAVLAFFGILFLDRQGLG
jgi:hypothetical protein